VNFQEYEALCDKAIESLGTGTNAVQPVASESLRLNGVTIDLVFDEPQSLLTVVCHLGQPAEEHRTQVYEQLLHLQMLSLHMPGLRFGYDPKLDEVLYCASAEVDTDTTPEWLAKLMSTMAHQAEAWRNGMLDGQMVVLAGQLEAELLAD
jgi:hypothetical protein